LEKIVYAGAMEKMFNPFPLTPALSLGERENI
jgi:hypothetical protein